MKPIFVKDLVSVPVHQVERQHYSYPLRTSTKKHKKTHPKKHDQEIRGDNPLNQLLTIMFGINETNDTGHNLLEKGNEPKGAHMKKVGEQKIILTTVADASDSETTVDYGWDENNDDEELKTKATRSYQTAAIVEEYEPKEHESHTEHLIEDDDVVVRANTPADGDNLDVGDNLEDYENFLEENIFNLIEKLDMTSENDIDKFLAQISDSPHNPETFKEDEKTRNWNELKSSWKDF